jgi:hypothetical protein
MSSWAELLDRAEPGEHVAQLYGADDQLLVRNVSRYLSEGLRRGDGVLLIATPEHTRAILQHLRRATTSVPDALRDGRLISLEAAATLSGFMREHRPDPSLFMTLVGSALRGVLGRAGSGRVRAFGEMVGLLWEQGNRVAAVQLEEYWNDLLKGNEFSLFCGYPIDLFEKESEMEGLQSVLSTHTHLLAGSTTLLSSAR